MGRVRDLLRVRCPISTSASAPRSKWFHQRVDPYWDEVLGRAVYMYVNANDGRSDVGLLLGQTALEALAWAIVVVDRKSMSAASFKAKPYDSAAARIGRLLDELRIARAVPTDLPALAAFSPTPTHTDGPAKTTWLRNRLAHPLVGSPGCPSSQVMVDAWLLSQWYLEAAILVFLGYVGTVYCRLDRLHRPFP